MLHARLLRTFAVMLAVAGGGEASADAGVAAKMRAAAQAIVATVDAGKRSRLVLEFASERRTDWHYTPRSRPGLAFADLDTAQRDAVHRLLRTALTAAGHQKVTNIIELELVLREVETFGLFRDPEKYFLVFFGTPDAAKPWGWRFEGHHLSLSFTLRGDAIATTPSFFGANPAHVGAGPRKGLRTLADEEDEGRRLLDMLDAGQRAAAVIDTRTYGDIVTRNADRVSPLDHRGLEAKALTPAQKAQLRKLIEAHAAAFEAPLREARLARAAESFDTLRFAWAGATERGKPHYYRVTGARFLVEYDASQDGGNHIHTVWRDFNGDFGRDLLREHHASSRGTSHRH
jgi:hypothetical protein